eukprot:TRINITY_DN12788_c0_g1_i1.p1 TRINITY_DN12788_c0_g1~~TRINITY_DN12788_c0_g1_i1.p1  ORF type:complete len:503 (-),score=54.06 TRINITY_DN12788_c0_g1_i1:7-1491(-)
MEKEDILENRFLTLLQTTYSQLYEQAQTNCWLVVVPQTSALRGLRVTPEIAACHILKPSPLFKEVYVVATVEGKTCEIEDQCIVEKEGWEEKRKIRIIDEELFYNQHYKPFKVLLVDQPMMGGTASHLTGYADVPQIMPNPKDWSSCLEYLRSFPENEIVLRKIDQNTEQFKQSYVLVKGFEDDAREKVSKLVETAIEQLLCANIFYRKMQDNLRQLRDISLIIESYVMSGLFDMICIGLRQLREADDYKTYSVLNACKVSSLTLKDFDSHPEMTNIDFSGSVSILRGLNQCRHPLQMLYVLTDSVDSIIATVENAGTGLMVTTDDLIPIITYVITQSDFAYYESCLYYIENFIFTDISTTKLGFNSTNFRASIMYMKSKAMELVLSIPPTLAVGVGSGNGNGNGSGSGSGSTRSLSMLHRSTDRPSKGHAVGEEDDLLISIIANTSVKSHPKSNKSPASQHFQPPPSVINVSENNNNNNGGDDFLQYLKTLSS